MIENNKIEFLAIGDIVIDAFIKLNDAHEHKGLDGEQSDELCLRFGDKVPYESVDVLYAVGNSPNAAVSASRLGLRTALLSTIGDDRNGQECLESLKKDNIITDYIKTDAGKKTNYHYVLWYKIERTILIKHEAFNYHLPSIPEIGWIYLSSMAENSLPYHAEIIEFLKNHPETKLAFQPGTFQMKLGTEKLKDVYARTEIFFCNLEEAERILNIQNKDIKVLVKGIHDLGPKIVAISDGPNGAYASDGTDIYFVPMYNDGNPPFERTGAGDAFSSTFTVAIAQGKTIQEALSWGPINSMSVVKYVGAQKGLLAKDKLEEYLSKAPETYKVQKLV
ncbi:MAG: carbohydrate kinase family protein [Candidatus Nomurabacteria bacterium]|nr:carbohydrate kinase family protein [Candidatus Nomurabacteria bacterium]